MRVGWQWGVGLLVMGVSAAACSSEPPPSAGAFGGGFGGGGGFSGAGGFGAGGAGGAGAIANTPCLTSGDCPNGGFCSARRECAPNGTCLVNADCIVNPGTFCSQARSCIATGACVVDADCSAGEVCDTAAASCSPIGGCAPIEFMIEAVPPNLMLVLDRSCSMRNDWLGNLNPSGPNKWTYAVDAVGQLTTKFMSLADWGLILFPDSVAPNCEQAVAAVPVAPGSEAAIQTLLVTALDQADVNYPDGPCVTNIDTAMQQTSSELSLVDATRERFAVLITGSQQAGCTEGGGDAGTEQTLNEMSAAGIPTFVVGLGGDESLDSARLDAFAIAGAVPNADAPHKYYRAEDAEQLAQALDAIVGSVTGCTFSLDFTPLDPSAVHVFLDNWEIMRDSPEGWAYDPVTNRIEFFGSACQLLRGQHVTDIDIVFGCRQPTPT